MKGWRRRVSQMSIEELDQSPRDRQARTHARTPCHATPIFYPILNSPPMVGSLLSWNSSFTNRRTRLDFPTAASPMIRAEKGRVVVFGLKSIQHRTGHHQKAIHLCLHGPWVVNIRKGAQDGFWQPPISPHVHLHLSFSHMYINTHSQWPWPF